MTPLDSGPLKSRNKQRKSPDYTAMKIIKELILTQRGWFIRQALKLAAAGGTFATGWLVAHNINVDGDAIGAAVATLAVGLTEMGLSYLVKSQAVETK